MRSVGKLVRNGNSTQITVLRPILVYLGWRPGDLIQVEVQEDKTLRVSLFDPHERNARKMLPVFDAAAPGSV